MPNSLILALSPLDIPRENLVHESAEERATFGLFSVTATDHLLTAGEATIGDQDLRYGPHVPGYPIAEWLVWNWWRLRWEIGQPPPATDEKHAHWNLAHQISTIGRGYAWPNIMIDSDGVYTSLSSFPSRSPETSSFRYIGAQRQTVPVRSLETAIEDFVDVVLTRLDAASLRNTNLHCLWKELQKERTDANLAQLRRLEAQLGLDPDEAEETEIRCRLDDALRLGENALGEIAADAALSGNALGMMMTPRDFAHIAHRHGFETRLNDVMTLRATNRLPQPEQVEAWRWGEQAAKMVRFQEGFNGGPIADTTLAAFAGSMRDTVSSPRWNSSKISFVLVGEGPARISIRARRKTGRRFDLARLIGDQVFTAQNNASPEPLQPATRTSSYRQRAQRAFAAELLSPFTAIDDMLGGDYSEEGQDRVAKHFDVSSLTIRNQLLHHRRIRPEDAPDIMGESL